MSAVSIIASLAGWILTTLPLLISFCKFLKHRNRTPSV